MKDLNKLKISTEILVNNVFNSAVGVIKEEMVEMFLLDISLNIDKIKENLKIVEKRAYESKINN